MEKIGKLKNKVTKKRLYLANKLYSEDSEIAKVRIKLASPEEIKGWATIKIASRKFVGQVKTGDTVNYKTLRPVMEGLFCEKVFGPFKDFKCACGKNTRDVTKNKEPDPFCKYCKVEYTWSAVRRTRLGYIHLNLPVTHVWYLRGRKNFISILLGFRRNRIERVAYCIEGLFSFTPKKISFLTSSLLFNNQIFKQFSIKKSKKHSYKYLNGESDLLEKKQKQSFFGVGPVSSKDSLPFVPKRKALQERRENANRRLLTYYSVKRDFLLKKNSAEERTNFLKYIEEKRFNWKKDDEQERRQLLVETENKEYGPEDEGLEIIKEYRSAVKIWMRKASKEDLEPPRKPTKFGTWTQRFKPEYHYKDPEEIQEKPKRYKFKEFNNGPLFQRYHQEQIFPISNTFYWEYDEQEHHSNFYNLLTRLPEKSDFPNPLYSKKVKNVELNLSDFDLTSIKSIRKKLSHTGALIIKERLRLLNLRTLLFILKKNLTETTKIITKCRRRYDFFSKAQLRIYERLLLKRARLAARLRVSRDFFLSENKAEWMVLSNIPVIPPDLRPIVPLDGDMLAVSDLNKFYQQIVYRNSRFKESENSINKPRMALRLVQDGVDNLIENGKGYSEPRRDSNDRPLKSLSDILKGKKGRFRFNLLGKRVDYSGRSVIIVGPTLKLHQCGLPKEMAVELFQPFLIRKLLLSKYVISIVEAKRLIRLQHPIIWQLLQSLMRDHPILLNRAPTLHRLGIQAFQPKLVNGRAILLHPLVCPSFNADFDGDQMGVHIPLSFEARAEAWKIMWSRNNLLSPATGQPILLPTQDMVLGCYYLTYFNFKKEYEKIPSHYFSDFNDLLKAYYQKIVSLHQSVWVRKDGSLESEDTLESPLEIRVNGFGQYNQIFSTYQYLYDPNGQQVKQYIRTTPGRVLLNQIFFH